MRKGIPISGSDEWAQATASSVGTRSAEKLADGALQLWKKKRLILLVCVSHGNVAERFGEETRRLLHSPHNRRILETFIKN